jgi:hypothetical protein
MYFVFGDSHSRCFESVFKDNVYSFSAASAKGLNNTNSISGVNKQIIEKTTSLPEKSNIIMFFGKVDLDFVINYKYNTTTRIILNEYVISVANSYIEFVKSNIVNKNIFICELPITHIDDKTMLDIICLESNIISLNKHLETKDKCEHSKFSKVIPFNERVSLYNVFNEELKNKCKINSFNFLEINKFFKDDDGSFKIPLKYVNTKNRLDHHLLPNIVELFMKSLSNE